MNCPVCTLPMAWSEIRGRMWCSVYGSHPEQAALARRRVTLGVYKGDPRTLRWNVVTQMWEQFGEAA